MGFTFDSAKSACAALNAVGIGRVKWRRVSTSGGSGKERKAGQWDARDVTKAQVYTGKDGTLMVMFFLPPDGTGANTMRRVRLSTVIYIRPGAENARASAEEDAREDEADARADAAAGV
jgi:hypothetical protein